VNCKLKRKLSLRKGLLDSQTVSFLERILEMKKLFSVLVGAVGAVGLYNATMSPPRISCEGGKELATQIIRDRFNEEYLNKNGIKVKRELHGIRTIEHTEDSVSRAANLETSTKLESWQMPITYTVAPEEGGIYVTVYGLN
jgi:hypothetical protein